MSEIASFPRELPLDEGPLSLLDDASQAIKEEYRHSVRWKRLRCREVATPAGDGGDNDLFELDVGHSIQLDWTWEGSIAFRPIGAFNEFAEAGDPTQSSVWTGEVVELDETEGRLFVIVRDPQHRPTTGTFYIRPFEFLANLNDIYNDQRYHAVRQFFPAILNACRGGVHPRAARVSNSGLKELQSLWSHSWALLWGPPGTGKTYTIGQQIAALANDATERILIVSTTNKATDQVALSVGKALVEQGEARQLGSVLRLGKGADYDLFVENSLERLLEGSESEMRRRISALNRQLDRTKEAEIRARLRQEIQELRRLMQDTSLQAFRDPSYRTIVATAFNAVRMLTQKGICDQLEDGNAPFTTVIIDEAGLISKAAVAALASLASRRVVLVGDPRQLSPITRMSRVLPFQQATWLNANALSHLQPTKAPTPGLHMLNVQHRMHPTIRNVVSKYQYGGLLQDAPTVLARANDLGEYLQGQPRAIWYVLDEDCDDLSKIRAERGPGNRSWVRPKTQEILDKLLADPALQEKKGVFLSPFAAQAKSIRSFLSERKLTNWHSSTVHSRQGTEADFVIFDTVNAGSYGWSYDEWQRLVNVGISRARELVVLLASRHEMQEPYLSGLLDLLAPRILVWRGSRYFWEEVPTKVEFSVPPGIASDPNLLGPQLEKRKALRPVLSSEQQRLCGLQLDGKPRLVRGVAGSGKTLVLAHWLKDTLIKKPEAQVWVVYANAALKHLVDRMVANAWQTEALSQSLPWGRIRLYHVKHLLEDLFKTIGRTMDDFDEFDYDAASEAYLQAVPPDQIAPRCDAMFVDEAQDFGPNALHLLTRLARQVDPNDHNSRAVMIFYDNAQNLYYRATPTWSEFGLDMRGRSTVMKESFRSTKPITEFALNVLYRFVPPEADPDYRELVARRLVEPTERECAGETKPWWVVRFNNIDGPLPIVRRCTGKEEEMEAIGKQLVRWIQDEGVKPSDIRVIYIHRKQILSKLMRIVGPMLHEIDVRIEHQTGQRFSEDARTIVLTTANSFKGYDSEVVLIAGADYFASGNGVLAHSLYVAMTRARSVLAIFGQNAPSNTYFGSIMPVLEECLDLLVETPKVAEISPIDDLHDLLEKFGEEDHAWLEGIGKRQKVEREPIVSAEGEVLLEPLFWFTTTSSKYVCYGTKSLSQRLCERIEDLGYRLLGPGDAWE